MMAKVKTNEVNSNDEMQDLMAINLEDVINKSIEKDYSIPKTFFGTLTAKLAYDVDQQTYFIVHPFDKQCVLPLSKSLVALRPEDAGQEISLCFDQGCLESPIIMGKILNLNYDIPKKSLTTSADETPDVDNHKKLVLQAKEEIVLQCGKSSITLTKSGKVLIRGTYLVSRSSGINKIRGGSVQLN